MEGTASGDASLPDDRSMRLSGPGGSPPSVQNFWEGEGGHNGLQPSHSHPRLHTLSGEWPPDASRQQQNHGGSENFGSLLDFDLTLSSLSVPICSGAKSALAHKSALPLCDVGDFEFHVPFCDLSSSSVCAAPNQSFGFESMLGENSRDNENVEPSHVTHVGEKDNGAAQLDYLCLDCGAVHLDPDLQGTSSCVTCGLRLCPVEKAPKEMCNHCGARVASERPPVEVSQHVVDTIHPEAYDAVTTRWLPALETDTRLVDLHASTREALQWMPLIELFEVQDVIMTFVYLDGTHGAQHDDKPAGPAAAGFCAIHQLAN